MSDFKPGSLSLQPNPAKTSCTRRLFTKFLTVFSLLTIFAVSSLIAPAQNNNQSTATASVNSFALRQPVLAAGMWDFFSFLGFGSDDGKKTPPRPQIADAYAGDESESSDSFKSAEPITTDLANPCTSTNVVINVPSGSSIQAAINAANPAGGDTIQVAAGTFQEQLVINKCVTITGAGQGSTTILSPTTLANSVVPGVTTTQSIIEIRSNSYVTMSNLTVAGPVAFTTPTGYGIFVVENSTLNLSNAAVTDIRENPFSGNQRGLAIAAGRNAFNQIGSLILDLVTITGYQKGGIIVDRDGSTATINRTTVTGMGLTGVTGQNGIQISRGATATITNSTVSNNAYNNPNVATATGINVFNAGATSVSNNTLTSNDAGIYNTVSPLPTPPATLPAFTVSGNTISNTDLADTYGVILFGSNGSLTNNFITGTNFGVLGYPADNAVINIRSNSITGSGANGSGIDFENYPGTTTVNAQLSANFNRIAGNDYGAFNNTSSSFNAENNFWGCNTGPNTTGCDAAGAAGGTIDFDPFLILSNTTRATSPVSAGGTSVVTTNLRFNSDNVNTFTATNHLPNPIPSTPTSANSPNGIPVNFSATNGTVSPAVTPLVDGLAQTTFTGGTVNGGDQAAVITARVDNATDTANVTVLDATPPTVVSATGSQTTATTVTYTVTFSEAVTGVDTGDFTLTTTGGVVASITSVSGSGSTRTVLITVTSGMGTITLNVVDNDTIVDTASAQNPLNGTGNGGTFTGTPFTVDVQMPTVTINQSATQTDPTNAQPINFTVVFSEVVTDFDDASDVVLSGTAGNLAGATIVITPVATTTPANGTTYNVAVSGLTTSGTVIANVAANAAVDATNNGNAASTSTDNTVNFFNGAITFLVDDDGMGNFNPVTGAINCAGTDPILTTIQSAITASSAGDTIRVCPGTYAEQLNINKDLTLLGPNDTVNPNTGTRTAEAIIVPTSSDPGNANGPIVVTLATSGITFQGFTVDGDNQLISGGFNFNGADVNAVIGIFGFGSANPDAVITNNIVQNIGDFGIRVTSSNMGGPRNPNSVISQNKVDNILGSNGQAIRIERDAWISVLNNVILRSRNGIAVENYTNFPTNRPASVIGGNNISSFRRGIRFNLHYGYGAPDPGFTLSTNTITPYVPSVLPPQVAVAATQYQGIGIESVSDFVPVTVSDNTLTGNRAVMTAAGYTRLEGLLVTNVASNSPNIVFNGNSVTDFIRGAFNEAPAIPKFNCNNIFSNTTGIFLSSAATNGLIANNNNIVGNGFGLQNDGPATVNAQMNFWGAADGPMSDGTAGNTAAGRGDKVSTRVDFSNFLTTQSTCATVIVETFPTVTITQATTPQTDPTSDSPVNFTVVFSEPVSGFATGDVTVSGSAFGPGSSPTAVVTGSGTTYNVAVSGMNRSGTVSASIPVGVALSVSQGNPNSASTSTDNTVFFNFVGPNPGNILQPINPVNIMAQNFGFVNESINGGTASGAFVTGPATPPAGNGSAQLTVDVEGRINIATNRYGGTRLADISALQYSAYSRRTDGLTITLQFDVDYNLSDTNFAFQNRLIYEPSAQGISVTPNTWQPFDTLAGKFYASGSSNPGITAGCTQASPCTKQQLLAAFPNVGIYGGTVAPAQGGLYLRAGGPTPGGMIANADRLVVGVNGNQTTFDFEPSPPTVSIDDVTATEGSSATFTVSISQASVLNTTVTVTTGATGDTATAGTDYTALPASQTVTILAGSTSATVSVATTSDTTPEDDETFTVTLSNALNAAIADGTGTGTITNDDVTISFSSATYSVSENAASGTASISVCRDGVTTSTVGVTYATSNGTATAPTDYAATTGTLSFAPTDTCKSFTIPIVDDNISETPPPTMGETVNLTLSMPTGGAVLGTISTAVLTILDNDGGGFVSIGGRITQSGVGLANVTVTLSGNSTQTVQTDSMGNYSFSGLISGGTYSVTPSCPASATPTCNSATVFDPSSREFVNIVTSVSNANFLAFDGDLPRNIRVGNTNQSTIASNVTVPIFLDSQGDENSFNFKLNFNSTLTFVTGSEVCGSGAPAGCEVTVTPAMGGVIVQLDLPSGVTFQSGPREAVRLTFSTMPNTTPGSLTFNTQLTFDPAARQVSNVQGVSVPADFVGGQVVFAQGLEGDIAGGMPAASGIPDGNINAGDLTRLRALIAGSATLNPNVNEFQRADVATFVSRGDGVLNSGDVTVLRRYISGDLMSVRLPAQGPTQPNMSSRLALDTKEVEVTDNSPVAAGDYRIGNANGVRGQTVTVAIELDSRGLENSFNFSLDYEEAKLSSPVLALGSDAAGISGATITPVPDAANGRIGVLVDFAPGATLTPAGTKQIVTVTFNVNLNAAAGPSPITFVNMPLGFYTSDVNGDPLASNYSDTGTVNITLVPTAATATVSGRVKNSAGKGVGGATVTLTDDQGNMRSVKTDLRGRYRVTELQAGRSYIVNVVAKFYNFAPQVITVTEDLAEFDLLLQE